MSAGEATTAADLSQDFLGEPSEAAVENALLRRLALVDAPSEAIFDRLTELVRDVLNAPIALVSIVQLYANRQFFKRTAGLPGPLLEARKTELSYFFCGHVRDSGAPLIIHDTHVDPRFADTTLSSRGNWAAAMVTIHLVLSFPVEVTAAARLSERCRLINGLVLIDARISGESIITPQAGQELARDVDRLVGLFASEPLRRSMHSDERSRYSAALLRLRNLLPGSGVGAHAIPSAILRLSAPQKKALHDDFLTCTGPEAEVVTSSGREPDYQMETAATADVAANQPGSSRRPEGMVDGLIGAEGVATASGVDLKFSLAVLVLLSLLGFAGVKAARNGRSSERFACLVPARLKIGPLSQKAEIFNISRNGCKLRHNMLKITDGRCGVEFGGIAREGRIVWSNQHYAGIMFVRTLSQADLSRLLSGMENRM